MPHRPVYLDHAATSPLSPAAREVILAHLDLVGNPNSLHGPGRAAHRLVEESRERLAVAIGVHPSEILFTSGGTEADNLGLKGTWWASHGRDAHRRGILLTGAEHHAVLDAVEWLVAHEGAHTVQVPLLSDGRVDLGAWESALATHGPTLAVATLMWANNEVGTVQPIQAAAALASRHGVPMHSDAVQALGHVPVELRAPGLSSAAITAHKLGGPVGIGALVLGRDQKPVPLQHGGGHERSLRSGTLDAVGAAAFAAAAQEAMANLEEEARRQTGLRDRLIAGVRAAVPDAVLNGPEPGAMPGSESAPRLPGNAHFTFPGCEGDSVLFMLDMAGIASSTGSACTAGVAGPSHVLMAMGRAEAEARCVQRFSLGATSTLADVDALLAALPAAVAGARAAGLSGVGR
ncbi:cysteine desulfurase family protein [Galactobacter caseinivorans]|uniref:cysteine desulfurase family protein n=1 Tax=Galactobacter caseinivorans TaxID=2676123 RepID=UPI001F263601|nr:cysteine desulfurase family protein [Galactobacter caseinivorans]